MRYKIREIILCTESGKLLPLEVVEDKILTEPLDSLKKKVLAAFDTMRDKPVNVHFDIINLENNIEMTDEERRKQVLDAARSMRAGTVLQRKNEYQYHYWEGYVEFVDTKNKGFEKYLYVIDSDELKHSHQPRLNMTGFLGLDKVLLKRDMPQVGDKVRLRCRVLKNQIPSYEKSKVIEVLERAGL